MQRGMSTIFKNPSSQARLVTYLFTGFLFICVIGFASLAHAQAQTPWRNNENGTLRTGIAWNYTLGYNFTPQTNGQVTMLGGFFDGTKKVSLWKNGQLLATTNVTSANAWSYVAIPPVDVDAGETYTVAAYLAGSGGSYRLSIDAFPQVYGDVQIDNTTWVFGDGVPISTSATYMFGQVDIEFVPAPLTCNICGDGVCDATEGYAVCATDCPSPTCGNGTCESNENGLNCQPDCPLSCGDGLCQASEEYSVCQTDCPSPACGNGVCDPASPATNFIDETFINCLIDCPLNCCIPDPPAVTCAGIACGEMVNNCGDTIICPDTCTFPEVCNGNTCVCVPDPPAVTCAGIECGSAIDNCGNNIICPDTCAFPEVCSGNTCVCVPEPIGTSCALIACGDVINNCGQTVVCPDTCTPPEVCTGNVCTPCVPDPISFTCAGIECGQAIDNCGNAVICPNTCTPPEVCTGNVCAPCVPDPVAVTCAGIECGSVIDNCGNNIICPDTCVAPQTCNRNVCL